VELGQTVLVDPTAVQLKATVEQAVSAELVVRRARPEAYLSQTLREASLQIRQVARSSRRTATSEGMAARVVLVVKARSLEARVALAVSVAVSASSGL
jgi:predicted mannosyl-3-phosphoglycerate phosphatase (HAD superfamily)